MFESKDWKQVNFVYPTDIPTMISAEEKTYLYWLGMSVWSGVGRIVEIGPWLGGSTACLAAGMRESGHDATKQLHVFDNYLWRKFMADRAALPIEIGDSFEPFFLNNISLYQDIVCSHRRALPDEVIDSNIEAAGKRFQDQEKIPMFGEFSDGPIEILFIDGAKSWLGMRHLLKTLNKNLLPGKSLIVCQDFKYWGCYWVPLILDRLGKYLIPIHNVHEGSTVTFRLNSEIPGSLIDELENHVCDIDAMATITQLERASQIPVKDGDYSGSVNVLLGEVMFLSHQGKNHAAFTAFKKIESSWPTFENVDQLSTARIYLQSEQSCIIREPARFKFARLLSKILRKISHTLNAR